MQKARKQNTMQTQKPSGNQAPESSVSRPNPDMIEFHRNAIALMPDPEDTRPGVAMLVDNGPKKPLFRTCTCPLFKKKTCSHLLKLSSLYKVIKNTLRERDLAEDFNTSVWRRLSAVLAEDCDMPLRSIHLVRTTQENGDLIRVLDNEENELLVYLSQGPDKNRFVERCLKLPGTNVVPSRGEILDRLSLLTMRENERIMAERGFKTRRQVMEESFWFRLAYHGYREFGASSLSFEPAIEEFSGEFYLKCKKADSKEIFRLLIPRKSVKRVLTNFRDMLINQHLLPIHPIPLKSLFKVNQTTELDLEVRHLIQIIQENGEDVFLEGTDLERYRYGSLVYIKELGVMAELEEPGSRRKFRAPVRMVLKKSQIPSFLEEIDQGLHGSVDIINSSDKRLQILKKADRIEISPDAIERDWYWLSVTYGFGNASVSLAEMLRARKEGQRFIPCREGWIDCESETLASLKVIGDIQANQGAECRPNSVRLSLLDLFRMQAGIENPMRIIGDSDHSAVLNRALALKPVRPMPPLKGMTSPLRNYQKLGVEWLSFLVENGFGGLLCDDMGLGKTHEVMALMLFLKEHGDMDSPFLVICPTTVLSHWSTKIREHAPGLKPLVYHGTERNLGKTLEEAHVILTSYGILLRDIDHLKTIPFNLVVFDEIQHLKNPKALTHRAAHELQARIKLGLTGTPIENHVGELKALMDLTVPGYLGKDSEFETRYCVPIQVHSDRKKEEELRRLVSPFILRRLKKSVLTELPEKIEDIRTCVLSEDQVRLYREVISSKGKPILNTLRSDNGPLPYMHIFAVLNLLKQICNHPVMLEDSIQDFDKYRSGKWELFKELLSEILESGQKVVIYSQFLKTIELMKIHLTGQDVECAVLTGSSRKRGEIIERFNNDPDCRVFLGSLKAGGTGIDLVAASVVIHYDRWWNAAREDQATDRVHRIGQRRGVQVFKLVTEGTLEEKISAIIDKKRNLMESIIKEDDSGLLKIFSRDELIEMLSIPAQ